MKVKDLKHSQYFHAQNDDIGIIGRKVDSDVVYLNTAQIIRSQAGASGFNDMATAWGNIEVEPINLQTAILLLAQECIKYPPVNEEFFDPNERKLLTELPVGEYFAIVDSHQNILIARKFTKDKIFYLNETNGCWDYIINVAKEVVPLSIHHAVLTLAQAIAA